VRYRTAILAVKVVIKPQMDQFPPATASTAFGEVKEIRDSVSGESQCHMELHELILAI